MTVGEFCNRQVVIARRDEYVTVAAQRMRDLHVGTLVVVDAQDGRRIPVGLVTDRDLVVRVLSDGARAVIKKMRSFGVRRLPVVNDRGGLEGILSVDDLIDLVAEELSDLKTLVSREQKRERETKSSL